MHTHTHVHTRTCTRTRTRTHVPIKFANAVAVAYFDEHMRRKHSGNNQDFIIEYEVTLYVWYFSGVVVNVCMYKTFSPSTMAMKNPLLQLPQLKTIQRIVCVHVSTMNIFGKCCLGYWYSHSPPTDDGSHMELEPAKRNGYSYINAGFIDVSCLLSVTIVHYLHQLSFRIGILCAKAVHSNSR